jgi:hypothetical protein
MHKLFHLNREHLLKIRRGVKEAEKYWTWKCLFHLLALFSLLYPDSPDKSAWLSPRSRGDAYKQVKWDQ